MVPAIDKNDLSDKRHIGRVRGLIFEDKKRRSVVVMFQRILKVMPAFALAAVPSFASIAFVSNNRAPFTFAGHTWLGVHAELLSGQAARAAGCLSVATELRLKNSDCAGLFGYEINVAVVTTICYAGVELFLSCREDARIQCLENPFDEKARDHFRSFDIVYRIEVVLLKLGRGIVS